MNRIHRIGWDGQLYVAEPAPRSNPEGRLDGAWLVRVVAPGQTLAQGKVVKRFQADGRDQAEAFVLERARA